MLKPRAPSESAVETTHLVLPPDTNTHGTAFGGRIMQWMDIIAGISAGRHAGRPVVTAAVDELGFASPIRMGDVVILKACVNYTGRTSMDVGVRVESEDMQRNLRHCLSGYFTFVALGDDGKPSEVCPVLPGTDVEKLRYDNGKQRRDRRLASRKNS